ncbi:MAG: ribonuclease E inhibitor RraB [Taibaiella sp.]|nr:ribonuclease E inhibitor RraB [Taibaiella sp.]
MRFSVCFLFFMCIGLAGFCQANRNCYVSEAVYQRNLSYQVEANKPLLKQLRSHGVTEANQCKLEYFFYTDIPAKAAGLHNALVDLGYKGEHRASEDNPRIYVVTGWTTKILMTEAVLGEWSKQMCTLGYHYDCDFDGWGTNDFIPVKVGK